MKFRYLFEENETTEQKKERLEKMKTNAFKTLFPDNTSTTETTDQWAKVLAKSNQRTTSKSKKETKQKIAKAKGFVNKIKNFAESNKLELDTELNGKESFDFSSFDPKKFNETDFQNLTDEDRDFLKDILNINDNELTLDDLKEIKEEDLEKIREKGDEIEAEELAKDVGYADELDQKDFEKIKEKLKEFGLIGDNAKGFGDLDLDKELSKEQKEELNKLLNQKTEPNPSLPNQTTQTTDTETTNTGNDGEDFTFAQLEREKAEKEERINNKLKDLGIIRDKNGKIDLSDPELFSKFQQECAKDQELFDEFMKDNNFKTKLDKEYDVMKETMEKNKENYLKTQKENYVEQAQKNYETVERFAKFLDLMQTIFSGTASDAFAKLSDRVAKEKGLENEARNDVKEEFEEKRAKDLTNHEKTLKEIEGFWNKQIESQKELLNQPCTSEVYKRKKLEIENRRNAELSKFREGGEEFNKNKENLESKQTLENRISTLNNFKLKIQSGEKLSEEDKNLLKETGYDFNDDDLADDKILGVIDSYLETDTNELAKIDNDIQQFSKDLEEVNKKFDKENNELENDSEVKEELEKDKLRKAKVNEIINRLEREKNNKIAEEKDKYHKQVELRKKEEDFCLKERIKSCKRTAWSDFKNEKDFKSFAEKEAEEFEKKHQEFCYMNGLPLLKPTDKKPDEKEGGEGKGKGKENTTNTTNTTTNNGKGGEGLPQPKKETKKASSISAEKVSELGKKLKGIEGLKIDGIENLGNITKDDLAKIDAFIEEKKDDEEMAETIAQIQKAIDEVSDEKPKPTDNKKREKRFFDFLKTKQNELKQKDLKIFDENGEIDESKLNSLKGEDYSKFQEVMKEFSKENKVKELKDIDDNSNEYNDLLQNESFKKLLSENGITDEISNLKTLKEKVNGLEDENKKQKILDELKKYQKDVLGYEEDDKGANGKNNKTDPITVGDYKTDSRLKNVKVKIGDEDKDVSGLDEKDWNEHRNDVNVLKALSNNESNDDIKVNDGSEKAKPYEGKNQISKWSLEYAWKVLNRNGISIRSFDSYKKDMNEKDKKKLIIDFLKDHKNDLQHLNESSEDEKFFRKRVKKLNEKHYRNYLKKFAKLLNEDYLEI